MTRIDTVDQLDALPEGSIAISESTNAIEKASHGWYVAGLHDRVPSSSIHLPATLLFVPGRDLVQEAQADAWDVGYDSGLFDGDAAHTPNPYRDEAPRQG